MPFFGAGVVDIPPKGFKREKNSRRMHMVFYVGEGKVIILIGSETEIAISQGGIFQVPRGEFCEFPHHFHHPHVCCEFLPFC